MPSTSPAQKRLMAAVAHGWKKPGGGGPSVAVAKEFNKADTGTQSFANGGLVMANKNHMSKDESYAKGGAVLGRSRSFLKESDGSDQKGFGKIPDDGYKNPDDPSEQDYSNKKRPSDLPATPKDKCLPTVKPRK